MQLPFSVANTLVWLDPSEKYVSMNSSNKVAAVQNRVDGTVAFQTAEEAKPTWSATSCLGKPGMTFAGAQFLSYNIKGQLFNGNTPFAMYVAAGATSAHLGFAVAMSNTSNAAVAPTLGIVPRSAVNSGSFSVFRYGDSGANTARRFGTVISDTTTRLFSFVYDGSTLISKINGTNDDTAIDVGGTGLLADVNTLNTMSVGGYNGDTVRFFFEGVIGQVVICKGSNVGQIEEYLLDYYEL